ncbi:hypothetical protein VJJ74_04670 [Parvimonas micra]|uniref:hypothetical protein n=1 Tax=Parvimonas micra TaxID=33033 RepID=UPI0022B6CED4|nr:hypothetical protein [Parvimonas micra]MEB3060437.1 hypothetical protein [Parvimonas micra]MEB3066294.1 hypothetical protein [Parvimonas micra]WBB29521.1 hypothetical protein NM223_00495 [Parvimonas micra]
MWLIMAIGAIIFALIGRIKEYKGENFIVFKRISLLIIALCFINFIYSAIIYNSYFSNTNWRAFLETMPGDSKNVLICIGLSIYVNYIPMSIFKK